MKKYILACLVLLFSLPSFAQIKNPGFELTRDTLKTMPQNWNTKNIPGFSFSLDNKVKYEGNLSFKITNSDKSNPKAFAPFSQIVDVNMPRPRKITFSVYIKTDNVSGMAGLWSQVRDKNNKTVGFQSLQMMNIIVNGTHDWTKYSISVMVDSNVKELTPGGFLMGTGSVWYDKFQMESPTAPPSKEAKNFIDEFTGIVKKNSIYTDSLNWAGMQADITELSKGLETVDDATLVTNYIIGKLREAGDHHSFIQSKTSAESYASGNTASGQPFAKLLPNRIGYISVPAFGSTNDTAGNHFAVKIQNLIHQLDSANNVKGWIVDLRQNGGGNMYPMIAGLGPLIGNGTLGYFVNSKSEYSWNYHNGNDGSVTVKNPYLVKGPGAKIAVLIGPYTASSGEATTISFIGKSNVKLIGQPTGGFTTANSGFKLSNGAYLYLACSYEADRNKKKYLGKINPDILVGNNTGNDDLTIDAAIAWITGK